jgi:hypothetical protein
MGRGIAHVSALAGCAGTERLAAAAQYLEEELARIPSGMSDLYAALLEAEAGTGVRSGAGSATPRPSPSTADGNST